MSLSEADIVRFSRHILLPEVGGVGQERLCAQRILCLGSGRAVDAARTYLSAGGADLGPVRAGDHHMQMGELPAAFSGTDAWIAILGSRLGARVALKSEGGCRRCFDAELVDADTVSPALATEAGALAAAVAQQLALGLLRGDWAFDVAGDGSIDRRPLRRCDACL